LAAIAPGVRNHAKKMIRAFRKVQAKVFSNSSLYSRDEDRCFLLGILSRKYCLKSKLLLQAFLDTKLSDQPYWPGSRQPMRVRTQVTDHT
jgi:hypothetical protein